MVPKKLSKPPLAPVRAEYSQSDSQDASQDSGSMADMAKKFGDQVKQKTAERRKVKTAAVENAHDDRIRGIRADVKACFESHDTQLRAVRHPRVERLVKLTNKKLELEARIDRCQGELVRSFEEAAQQLQASIDGRVEDLSA